MRSKPKRGVCGKRDFPTKADALSQLDLLMEKRHNGRCDRRESNVYFCGRCLGWHLTSRRTGIRHDISDERMSMWRIAAR